jgi:hypothetical protein
LEVVVPRAALRGHANLIEGETGMEITISEQQKTLRAELLEAEQHEAELREEYRPLIEERIAAEMNGKGVGIAKERRINSLRSAVVEAEQIVAAKRGRLRQLHVLSISKDVEAARAKQHEFVDKVLAESAKITPLLGELEAIRSRMRATEDAEYVYIRSVNFQLGLEGNDRIQERLRHNLGNVLPPAMVAAEVFEEFAARFRKNLADF